MRPAGHQFSGTAGKNAFIHARQDAERAAAVQRKLRRHLLPELRFHEETSEQLRVGSGEFVDSELVARDPFHGGAIERSRFATDEAAHEKFQMHGLLGVGVGEFCHQRADRNFYAEFFTEFANEALIGSLAGFAFAAGEFPQTTEVRVGVALGDEQFAVVKQERGGNFNRRFHRPMLL
jgi:hypothetical protein